MCVNMYTCAYASSDATVAVGHDFIQTGLGCANLETHTHSSWSWLMETPPLLAHGNASVAGSCKRPRCWLMQTPPLLAHANAPVAGSWKQVCKLPGRKVNQGCRRPPLLILNSRPMALQRRRRPAHCIHHITAGCWRHVLVIMILPLAVTLHVRTLFVCAWPHVSFAPGAATVIVP